jgi:hypothetical protein
MHLASILNCKISTHEIHTIRFFGPQSCPRRFLRNPFNGAYIEVGLLGVSIWSYGLASTCQGISTAFVKRQCPSPAQNLKRRHQALYQPRGNCRRTSHRTKDHCGGCANGAVSFLFCAATPPQPKQPPGRSGGKAERFC